MFKILLIFFITCNFLSCNGQLESKNNPTDSKSELLGKSVSKIDKEIWVVFQDQRENYWFGSNGRGLYNFDGKTLLQFTTSDGLVDNSIRGIQEDAKGNIYIETPNGISKFNNRQFTTLQPVVSDTNTWKLEPNDLWFGYNANDVYRYDGTSLFRLKLPRKDLEETLELDIEDASIGSINYPYAVYGVDKDKNDNIWFGTYTAGAFRYDGKSFLWFGEKELSSLPDGRVTGVRSMIQDKDGYFWLSNFYSKYKINPDESTGYEKMNALDSADEIITDDRLLYFNSGIVDKKGNLWMATFNSGVWKYDGNSLSNFELSSETGNVKLISIYQDMNGKIWLGTKDDGVYRQTGNTFEKFEPKIQK